MPRGDSDKHAILARLYIARARTLLRIRSYNYRLCSSDDYRIKRDWRNGLTFGRSSEQRPSGQVPISADQIECAFMSTLLLTRKRNANSILREASESAKHDALHVIACTRRRRRCVLQLPLVLRLVHESVTLWNQTGAPCSGYSALNHQILEIYVASQCSIIQGRICTSDSDNLTKKLLRTNSSCAGGGGSNAASTWARETVT